MTRIAQAELERRLTKHLTEEVERIMATTDIAHQHDLLEFRLRQTRQRRRPVYLAALAATAAAAVVAIGVVVGNRTGGGHQVAPTAVALPRPAGTPLTVYQGAGSTPGSQVRVLSFLDTQGRWCVATLDSATAPTAHNYACRNATLPATGHGFGAVYGNEDAPTYDNFRTWFGGVATADVKRVTVVFGNGQTLPATVRDQGPAHAVVFSVDFPAISFPTYYRAYAANGHLIQQIRIQSPIIPSG